MRPGTVKLFSSKRLPVASLDAARSVRLLLFMFLVVLTGAGISAESGVQTFRDADGIWAKYDYREVATPEGFANNPALVHEFYNLRRAGLPGVEPNAAHIALAELEEALTARGDRFLLITQNVDDLHARAGSKEILQMHGSIAHARCSFCGQDHEWPGDLSTETSCPSCESAGGMRPAVVWFGEMPRHMAEIETAVSQATHFVAIGTSGTVYPAAGLAAEARTSGARTLLINLERAENEGLFDDHILGPAAREVPRWAQNILSGN